MSRNRFCDFLADPDSRSFSRFWAIIMQFAVCVPTCACVRPEPVLINPSFCVCCVVDDTATCIIIAPKRLKLRLSGSARKSQKRFRDTPRFKFQAVLARTQPFLSRSVEKRGDQSRFKCRKMVNYYAIRSNGLDHRRKEFLSTSVQLVLEGLVYNIRRA